MTPRTVVVNFGMPRSGTTLIQKMLEHGDGYFHFKLSENNPLHTCHSDKGLIQIARMFRRKRVIFVRTIRDMDGILASWQAGERMSQGHRFSYQQLQAAWPVEEANFQSQIDELQRLRGDKHDPVACHFSQVQFDKLGDAKARDKFIRKIAKHTEAEQTNYYAWSGYLADHWGTKPVNVGQLMEQMK